MTKYAPCYAACSSAEAEEVFQKGARFLSVASTCCSSPTSVRFVFGCRQEQRQPGNISLAALVGETVTERKCPSAVHCQLQAFWASLLIQRKGLLCSWPSQWHKERCILKYRRNSPLRFSVQEYCTNTQVVRAAVVPSVIWEKTGTFEFLGEGSCTYTQQFGNVTGMNVSGKQMRALAHTRCGIDNYFCHSSPSPVPPVKLPVL